MTGTLPTGARGQALALGLLALLLGLVWLAVVDPLRDLHAGRAEQLVQRQALADRMEAVARSLPQLRREASGAAARAAPKMLLDGASDALAGAALQGQVDLLAGQSGVVVPSSELLTVEAAGDYRRVGLRMSATGPWPAMVSLLQAIEQSSPRMLVDDLVLQPAPSLAAGANQPLGATFTVVAFRRASPG